MCIISFIIPKYYLSLIILLFLLIWAPNGHTQSFEPLLENANASGQVVMSVADLRERQEVAVYAEPLRRGGMSAEQRAKIIEIIGAVAPIQRERICKIATGIQAEVHLDPISFISMLSVLQKMKYNFALLTQPQLDQFIQIAKYIFSMRLDATNNSTVSLFEDVAYSALSLKDNYKITAAILEKYSDRNVNFNSLVDVLVCLAAMDKCAIEMLKAKADELTPNALHPTQKLLILNTLLDVELVDLPSFVFYVTSLRKHTPLIGNIFELIKWSFDGLKSERHFIEYIPQTVSALARVQPGERSKFVEILELYVSREDHIFSKRPPYRAPDFFQTIRIMADFPLPECREILEGAIKVGIYEKYHPGVYKSLKFITLLSQIPAAERETYIREASGKLLSTSHEEGGIAQDEYPETVYDLFGVEQVEAILNRGARNLHTIMQQGVNVHEQRREESTTRAAVKFMELTSTFDTSQVQKYYRNFIIYIDYALISGGNTEDEILNVKRTLGIEPVEPIEGIQHFGPLVGEPVTTCGLNLTDGKEFIARIWYFIETYTNTDLTADALEDEKENMRRALVKALELCMEDGIRICNPGKIQRIIGGVLQGRVPEINLEGIVFDGSEPYRHPGRKRIKDKEFKRILNQAFTEILQPLSEQDLIWQDYRDQALDFLRAPRSLNGMYLQRYRHQFMEELEEHIRNPINSIPSRRTLLDAHLLENHFKP